MLGHIVSEEIVRKDLDKVSAIKNAPLSGTETEMRSFLGIGSYSYRFITGFAHIAVPLHQLTNHQAEFK